MIGCGGMGIVMKAYDEKLQRLVAIKALDPTWAASDAARKRFVREAQSAAAVCHDHLVPIYAVEDGGAVPYFVMQYITGGSREVQPIWMSSFALVSAVTVEHALGQRKMRVGAIGST